MTSEEIFRQKAPHYLVCFVDRCPLRDRCLRWLVGQQADATATSVTCVNPLLAGIATDSCRLFRERVTARHARGMVHFYDEMPRRTEVAVKKQLIGRYARRQYYEYRNGVRLITPEMQQVITQACRAAGWTGTLHYDAFEDDYLW